MLPVPESPIPFAAVALLLGVSTARVAQPDTGTVSLWRQTVSDVVPAAAVVGLTVIVWTASVTVWAWSIAVVLGAAAALLPLSDALRIDGRPPTPTQQSVLERGGVDTTDLRVVDAGGRVTGFAVANPHKRTVAVSETALATLSPAALGALIAHERAHHERSHFAHRTGVSAGLWLSGAALVTATLSGPNETALALLGVLAVERLVAAAVARRTELAADAHAACETSPAAVVELLQSRHVQAAEWPGPLGVLSAHPTITDRIDHLDSPRNRSV